MCLGEAGRKRRPRVIRKRDGGDGSMASKLAGTPGRRLLLRSYPCSPCSLVYARPSARRLLGRMAPAGTARARARPPRRCPSAGLACLDSLADYPRSFHLFSSPQSRIAACRLPHCCTGTMGVSPLTALN
jgi:hypothetical protein